MLNTPDTRNWKWVYWNLCGILGKEEQERTVIPGSTVDNPHGKDETYGTEDADWREVLHGIQSMVLQNGESRSIGQRQRRHIERHAEGIRQP